MKSKLSNIEHSKQLQQMLQLSQQQNFRPSILLTQG